MTPPATSGSLTKSVLAAYRHPDQLINWILMQVALVSDRLMPTAPSYSAIDWPAALVELGGVFPGSARFLLEPEAHQIEQHAREKSPIERGTGLLARALDSDLTLARCLYLMCRALTPSVVVETGVANGMTSAFILQALAVNNRGVLHSIDLPLPPKMVKQTIGTLIPEELRSRWRLHLGSSRRVLPKIVRTEGIDMFIHDSLHTYKNMKREFQVVWPRIRSSGVLVSDDVETNIAFDELRALGPRYWQVVKQEQKPGALFGIAVHR